MISLLNKFDDAYIIQQRDALDIAMAYIKQNNLEPYLRDIFFSQNMQDMGNYNINTNTISLNDEKIIKYGYRMFDKLIKKYPISDDSYTYFLNFYYLQVLFHELTHVKQKSDYEKQLNDEVTIASYLYELCHDLRKDYGFYRKYHNLFSTEIEANNTGCLQAYHLMQYTKLPSRELKVMHLQYLYNLAYNYKKENENEISTPISKLAQKNENIDLDKISLLLAHTKLPKSIRLNFGLDISTNEFDDLEKARLKVLKKFK